MVLATFENTALEFEQREREKGTIHLQKIPACSAGIRGSASKRLEEEFQA
jgi:hypothetical protein